MKLKVTRVEIWTATIADRAGGTADRLALLSKAGVNLEMLIARRAPNRPGRGVVQVAPINGAKARRVARAGGFKPSKTAHRLRIEGPDRRGMSGKMTRALGNAGISFRSISAMKLGGKFVAYLSLDKSAHATKAAAVLRRLS